MSNLDPKCGCLACDGYQTKLAAWRGNKLFVVCQDCKDKLAGKGITWTKIPETEFSF